MTDCCAAISASGNFRPKHLTAPRFIVFGGRTKQPTKRRSLNA